MNTPDYKIHESFLSSVEATSLFQDLEQSIEWDTSIKARKTACFGETYDESGVDYEVQPMHEILLPLLDRIEYLVGFKPTNCLANYYSDGKSTMGFHSDTISNLEGDTGIVIVSLGAERNLTFRNIENYDIRSHCKMVHGSLFYMTQETQNFWTHAIKKAPIDDPRISLTFRRILPELKN